MQTPVDEDLRVAGVHLVRRGLAWVFVIAIATRIAPDEPWQGFAILYAFAWLAVWGGFRLLRRAGAWPSR
jgi:hypothetical protein